MDSTAKTYEAPEASVMLFATHDIAYTSESNLNDGSSTTPIHEGNPTDPGVHF